MGQTASRSLPWFTVVVVVVTLLSLAGAPNAGAGTQDPSSGPPRACAASGEDDPGEGLLAATDLSEPAASEAAASDADLVLEELVLAAFSDGSSETFQLAQASQPAASDTDLVLAAFADASPKTLQLAQATAPPATDEIAEYDPWMPFNEPMFTFNRQVDRYALKPAATVWDKMFPDVLQRSLSNALDNLGMPRRLVNKLAQARFDRAAQELGRFVLNSTIGFAGLFDIAKELGIDKNEADTGQTFGVYGAGPGPYLILPFLPPLTVRDGIGYAVDIGLDPLNYLLPVIATFAMKVGNVINERSLTLELFQSVEETVLDLYTAVRNAYLQRRNKVIEDARSEGFFRGRD